jgi:hypothetical protein
MGVLKALGAIALFVVGLLVWGFMFFVVWGDKDQKPSRYDFRYIVESRLKDKGSAKFRNEAIYPVPNKDNVYLMCGEVNAKNSLGAYVGFKRFIVSGNMVLIDDGTRVFSGLWRDQCRHPPLN